YIC
ncbi:CSS motif domain associated with EAL family protein, partial [Escherichia coli 95.1288]